MESIGPLSITAEYLMETGIAPQELEMTFKDLYWQEQLRFFLQPGTATSR
jgi:hypothetical protein